MDILDADPFADENKEDRRRRIIAQLDSTRDYLNAGTRDTVHPFNAYVSRSPLSGSGLFAKEGGLHPGDVLEFTEGHMGFTWSDKAFYNDVGGFVIHLKSGRCFIVEHHMDYKQTGPNGTDVVNACFCNAVARRGQVVDQHPRYAKPHHCTPKEIQQLYQTQTAVIGCLVDEEHGFHQARIYLEVKEYVPQDMELLTEYDLNVFSLRPQSSYDPRAQPQGFSVWTDHAKANWVLDKCETDPRNVGNLAVAILDMVRHDLDAFPDMDSNEHNHYHSSFFRDFLAIANTRFLSCDHSRLRARTRRESRGVMSLELVYQLDLFQGSVWLVLAEMECEITLHIHRQWLELHNLQARDNLGVLGPRPEHWSEYHRPWSQQWWEYLRRLDNMNEQLNRAYYVPYTLEDVRGLDAWNKPYGHK